MGIFNDLDYGRVQAGTWTKIYSGPRLQPVPLLSFNFRTVPKGSPDTSTAWVIRIYSSSVAYNSRCGGFTGPTCGGRATVFGNPDTLSPSLVLADPPSIWLDVWIFTDTTIDAKCW
jgi:hypothetical protein